MGTRVERNMVTEHGSIPVFVSFSQAFCLKQAFVYTMQFLLLIFGEQGIMFDIEQVIDDEPYWLLGGHPVLFVEARQIHRNGIASKRALAPQVEVGVEVTESKFA